MSLHRGEDSRFDWRGALDAIHAGAVVVTEPSSGIAPLVPGEHLLVASADALAYVVEDLLRDDGRLARLRSQAYDRLKAWVPYALPVSVLRAAVVELVGEPMPSGVSLHQVPPRPERSGSVAGAVARFRAVRSVAHGGAVAARRRAHLRGAPKPGLGSTQGARRDRRHRAR